MPKQPQLELDQQFNFTSVPESDFLPTLIIGERYDLVEYPTDKDVGALSSYDGNDPNTNDYSYPEKNTNSVVELSSVKIFGEQVNLKYYDSEDEGSTWRKLGSSSNKIRTILSSGLIFKTDANKTFPHSSIFKQRGVKEGDIVEINSGSFVTKTKVVGFEADKSTASIAAAVSGNGNKAAQSHNIASAVVGGGNSTNSTLTVDTSGTYKGNLTKNVLEDTYTVKVVQSGTSPTVVVNSDDSDSTLVVSTNEFYDFVGTEVYTIEVMTGGALETATYRVLSLSGVDNIAETVTPALSTLVNLSNSRGIKFQFTGSGTLTAGDKYVITVTPSQGRLSVSTASGEDLNTNRLFPGYGVFFPIGSGIEIKLVANSSANLKVNDSWTITAQIALDKVITQSGGTFTGKVDINYIVEVVQGGVFGVCAIRVQSTSSDSQSLVVIPAHTTAVDIGDFGVTIAVASNSQGGLILGDIFTIKANAAKDTTIKTLVLNDALPAESNSTSIGAATYTGSTGSPNTGTSGGTYNASVNKALDLNNTEVYTIVVTTDGTYNVAEITWTSSSGLDDSEEPVTIPTTPGTAIPIGVGGATIAFTGGNDFELTDSWTISISKTDLEVKLMIRQTSVEIPEMRVDTPSINAWVAEEETITINSGIKLLDSSWDSVEALPIESAILYIDYRALHVDGSEEIFAVSQNSQIEETLGRVSLRNPVANGVSFALQGAALGTNPAPIFVAYVSSLGGYEDLLEQLELRDNSQVYRIIPMSSSREVSLQVLTHINKMSTSTKNKWRNGFFSIGLPDFLDIVGEEGDSSITAVVIENPASLGTYNILKTTDGDFSSVLPSDKVKYLGKDYTVVSQNNATEITVTPSFVADQDIPSDIHIFRSLSKTDKKNMFKFFAESLNSRRATNVVPDTFIKSGVEYPMFYFCAYIGGYRASVHPHLPMSTLPVPVIDKVPLTLSVFNDTDLEEISDSGNLIIQQDSVNGVPYIRHQLTTDLTDLLTQEISITENFDDIAYGMLEQFKPYLGVYNLHAGVLPQISTNLDGYLSTKTEIVNDQAGPQIEDFTVTRLERDPNNASTLLADVEVSLPAPFNYGKITVVASAAS